MNDLIDTTEMYLRTVYELEEEGTVPLRARIAERLHQSGPTVSQTVARMERDGLVRVAGDRHLELTDAGRRRATAVMRKHRLAERLLVEVIGLDWEDVHLEACRWEHVMSEQVERRLVALLDHPTISPYGNPIPGLGELGELGELGVAEARAAATSTTTPGADQLVTLEEASQRGGEASVRRISEHLQSDVELMRRLRGAGVYPGQTVTAKAAGDVVQVSHDGHDAELPTGIAALVFVAER